MKATVFVELLFGMFIVGILILAIGLGFNAIANRPRAIDVFSTRFDECMATEKFTRDECIVYAKGE